MPQWARTAEAKTAAVSGAEEIVTAGDTGPAVAFDLGLDQADNGEALEVRGAAEAPVGGALTPACDLDEVLRSASVAQSTTRRISRSGRTTFHAVAGLRALRNG